jgi:hypothetical protein
LAPLLAGPLKAGRVVALVVGHQLVHGEEEGKEEGRTYGEHTEDI